ncbi:hypothetical protein GFY24_05260 [Nocardia sp. SYP-A9097]|uniref:hypothetical protein n=1 Tax=Nocardia sp. SYP-A9097 TaxID=2663237 RepID=UPI00129BE73C|nr:hypothetical protein [Nocardia sp. SYP-A9097]MRH86882.1 hypothetical protein [Nocardia sp. SYP-A9097]
MPPQRRKSSIGGTHPAPTRNPLSDEAEHTPPVSPLRDAEWHSTTVTPAATAPQVSKTVTETEMILPPAMTAKSPAAMFITPSTEPPRPAPEPPAHTVESPQRDKDSTPPGGNTMQPNTKPGKIAEQPVETNAKSVQSSDNLLRPSDKSVQSSDELSRPSDSPVRPSDNPVPPSAKTEMLGGKPVQPTGKPVQRVGGAGVRGIDPALRSVGSTLRGAATASPSVLTMPLPAAGEGPLNASELEQLDLCESSIDALRVAFWVAGRALQIVRDGRLYRAEHATFDDYVEKRWDMQRSYAHKLIRAWPLAARLHPVAPSINEGQIRELLPIVAAHGEDAAFTVYTTLAADVKVTAGKLREAVAVLPHDYNQGEMVERLRSWLRGDLTEDTPHTPDVFTTAESRLAALTSKVVKGSTDDPIAAREFAAKLRTLAELIEEQLPIATRMPH